MKKIEKKDFILVIVLLAGALLAALSGRGNEKQFDLKSIAVSAAVLLLAGFLLSFLSRKTKKLKGRLKEEVSSEDASAEENDETK